MKSIKQSNQRIKDLAYVSLSLGINLIMIGLDYFIPFSSIILILCLPLVSVLVSLRVKYREQLVYFIALTLISLIDFQMGLFTIIPSALVGLLFGNLAKKKVPAFYIMLISSYLNFFLSYISIYPIEWIYNVSMIEMFQVLTPLKPEVFKQVFPLLVLLIAYIQTFLSFIIMSGELSKLNVKLTLTNNYFLPLLLTGLGISLLTIPFIFFQTTISYLLLAASLHISGFLIVFLYHYRKYHFYYYFIIFLILSVIFFSASFSFISAPYTIYGLLIINGAIYLLSFFLLLLNHFRDHLPINEETFIIPQEIIE